MKEKKRRIGTEEKISENAMKDETLRLSRADLDALVKNTFDNNTTLGIDDLEVYPKDVLREKARELQHSIENLYQAIDDAHASVGMRIHGNTGVSAHDILAYSHRLSYTSFAPPGYIPGKSMLYMHKPPAPQTAQFQNSILYTLRSQEQEDALYAPAVAEKKKEEDGGRIEQEQTKYVGGIDPELLKNLPPMPKEWSVGDPIPGLDTAAKEKMTTTKAAAELVLEKKPIDIINSKEAKEQTKKKPASGFAFALNPDLDADIEFGVDSDEGSSSSDDDF
ncbi:Mediator of RNA polymerase II transcription subunit 4 [Picochlorum sp. SENEW3]|nr:Mediator of RNA polymerase II transcription subunit 4 [Picochlorum sp. SENEW3]